MSNVDIFRNVKKKKKNSSKFTNKYFIFFKIIYNIYYLYYIYIGDILLLSFFHVYYNFFTI